MPNVRLTLRPLKHEVPENIRLRRLLKYAKRVTGFQLEKLEELPADAPAQVKPTQPQQASEEGPGTMPV